MEVLLLLIGFACGWLVGLCKGYSWGKHDVFGAKEIERWRSQ